MTRVTNYLCTLMRLIGMLLTLLGDGMRFLLLCLRPSPALAAENLFLRKQLALYQERQIKPRRPYSTVAAITPNKLYPIGRKESIPSPLCGGNFPYPQEPALFRRH
jgi:hypothetical protein